jgi:2,3-diaminopropionate biosynthesis protein SbnB
MDRASAVVILNCPQTGRPEAFIEGSIISAKRTGAGAALAAKCLKDERPFHSVGMIGCGLINREVARFLLAVCPEIERFVLYDIDSQRAERFKRLCGRIREGIELRVVTDINELFSSSPLISIATSASTPYISDISACVPGSVILHVSLRDLSPEVILSCDNIVDDIDHVCRARTSLHLAEQLVGHRDFIRCTLADISMGVARGRMNDEGVVVFSPFGLGILDLAVSRLVRDVGLEQNLGTHIEPFLPTFDWQDM